MVCSPSDWRACTVPAGELPARSGACYIGFDAGGSSSMTAAAAYWPETKRLPWSGSPKGERRLTLLSFHQVLTLRKPAFAEASFKLS